MNKKKLSTITKVGLASSLVISPLGNSVSATNSPNTSSTWDSVIFIPYAKNNGELIYDPANEPGISPDEVDFVSGYSKGSGDKPSFYIASNGTDMFFRMRLMENPYDRKGGFLSSVWFVQIAENGQHKATVGINGKSPHEDYVYVSNPNGTTVNSIYKTDSSGSHVPGTRVVEAENGQFFLDFQVPISKITEVAPSISSDSNIQLFFGTSKAANLSVINKDYMGPDRGGSYENSASLKLSPSLTMEIPTISITSSASFDSNTPVLSGATTKAAEGSEIELTINEKKYITTVSNQSWNIPVTDPLSTGTHRVTVKVVNELNNIATTKQAIQIGKTITIDGGETKTVSSFPTTVSGTFNNDNGGSKKVEFVVKDSNGVEVDAYRNIQVNNTTQKWSKDISLTLPEGTYTIEAVEDVKKNDNLPKAKQTIVIDNQIDVSITSPADNTTSDNPFPTVTGNTDPNAEVSVFIDSQFYRTVSADDAGNWSLTLGKALAPGDHTFKAEATDDIGNKKETSVYSYKVSSLDISIINGHKVQLNDNIPTIRGRSTAPDGSEILVKVGNRNTLTTQVKNGRWSVDINNPLDDATYSIQASVTSGGLTDSFTQELTIDSSTFVNISSPSNQAVTENRRESISGTAEPLATIGLNFNDGERVETVFADQGGNWTFTPSSDLSLGKQDVVVTASDVNGNVKRAYTSFIINTPGNSLPVIEDYKESIFKGESKSGQVTATDSDNDPLTYSKGSEPSNGTIEVKEDGTYTYTPDSDYTGTDNFTIEVSDGKGGAATSTVTIEIKEPPNKAPTTEDYSDATFKNETISGKVEGADADGDPLTYTKETDPSNGTVTVKAYGTWSYTPNTDYVGTDVFKVQVSDGKSTVTSTVTIDVKEPPNKVPTTVDYSKTTFKNEAASGKVEGTDDDNDPLTYKQGTKPSHGNVTVNEDGSWVYTPTTDYVGLDSFEVLVSDGEAEVISKVTIDVKEPPNELPSVENYSETTIKNEAVSGKVEATDADNDPLTYSKESGPSHGTVTVKEDGAWTYTPSDDYVGEDLFKVQVSDGKAEVTSTVTIDVKEPPNQMPTVENYQKTVERNQTLNGVIEGADPDGDPLEYSKGTSPQHGTLSVEKEGKWAYTPEKDYTGTDRFTISLSDGKGGTATSTVSITVKEPANQMPTAINYYEETEQNKPVSGTVVGSDPDKDVLTYSAEKQPSHGTLDLKDNGEWTYTPEKDYIGQDRFMVNVSDGKGGHATSTISVYVKEPVNQLPVVSNYNEEMEKNTSINGNVEGTDPDGDSLKYKKGRLPEHGVVEVTEQGRWSYTPDQDYTGTDSFTVITDDGKGGTATSTISVLVKEPVNQLPSAENSNKETEQNKPVSGKIEAIDPDKDPLTFKMKQEASQGSVVLKEDGSWVYTPGKDYIGDDSFKVEISDGKGGSVTSTVSIKILEPVNQLPVVDNYNVETEQGQSVNGKVEGTDPDGDSLVFEVGKSPAHGDLKANSDGSWNYTPVPSYVGQDSFSIKASDGKGGVATSTILINVKEPVNRLPEIKNYNETTEVNKAIAGKVEGTDPDGDSLVYSEASSPTHGSINVDSTGEWTYSPDDNYIGFDSFTIEVSDGKGGTATSTVGIHIKEPVNQLPVVGNYKVKAERNQSVRGRVSGTDPDGDSLTYSKGSSPSHGTVEIHSDGNWSYSPSNDYVGGDSFKVLVSDGKGGTATSTVSINVEPPVNLLPTVDNYTANTELNKAVSGKVIGNDADGDPLTYSIETSPEHGTLEVTKEGSWTYQPSKDYKGIDQFSIEVNDGKGGVVTSSITVNVSEPANHAPTVENYNMTTQENNAISGKVSGIDSDGDPLSYTNGSGPKHGKVSVNIDGSWTYTPLQGYTGMDSFTINVSDGKGGTSFSTVSINVLEPVNQLPTISNHNEKTEQNHSVSGKVEGKDSDGDALTYSAGESPSHGAAEVNADGSWTYTPQEDFYGTDSFPIKVSDGRGGVATSTILINVLEPVNNLPTVSNYNEVIFQGGHISGRIEGKDVDGDLLTYHLGKGSSHGTEEVNADGSWAYTPDKGYIGEDRFTIEVSDGKGGVTTLEVSILIKEIINHLPVVDNYNVVTEQNQPLEGKVEGSDSDGDPLLYSKAKDPEHGVVKVDEGGSWTYTPVEGYSGPDSFSVRVDDGKGGAATSTILVNVKEPVNHIPEVGNYNVTTEKNQQVEGRVIGSDADEDLLNYSEGKAPLQGTLVVQKDGSWKYTPDQGFIGTDSFTIIVSDGKGGTKTSTISLKVMKPVNQLPVVDNYNETTLKNQALNGKIESTDPDGDELTFKLEKNPQHGIVKFEEDGTWVYTPDRNYSGPDSFGVIISDGNGGTVTSTVLINVKEPENTLPTVGNYQEETLQDQTATGKIVGEDADGDKLSYALESDPSNGKVEMSEDGTWTYTPKEGFTGTDEFTVLVKDENGGTALSTITLKVSEPENTLPTVGNYQEETLQDQTATGKVVGEDADGDKLSYALESEPSNGKVEMIEDGTWTYTPKEGFTGTDEFKIKVEDTRGGNTVSTIVIQVKESENELPIVEDYTVETKENQSLSGIVEARDPEGTDLIYKLGSDAENGEVELKDNGSWFYTPDSGFVGKDQFKIKVTDARGGSSISMITVDVTELDTKIIIDGGAELKSADRTPLVSGTAEAPKFSQVSIEILNSDGKMVLKDYTSILNGTWSYMLEKELAPGSYEIVATLKSEADEKLNKSVQALEVEESNVSLELTSSPKAIVGDGKTKAVLTAIIKDGNGNPVKGERVSFSSKAGTLVNSEATTNDEGVAVVELISPDLSGTIESQQKVISAKVSNPDKNLYGESQIVVQYVPASVSGVIIDSSSKQPIPGSLIEVREDFNGDGVIDFEATAVTDSEGAYSIAVPYDNWDYTLNVTASTTLDGKKVPVNYSLKAKVGEIKGVGENIKSEKTISGKVFFLNRETNLPEEMDNQGKDINIKPVVLNSGDDDLEIKVDRNGKYVITGGQKGKSYDVMLNVEVEGENGEKQLMVGKKIKVDIPEDGISEVQTTLIDPYGVVTDEETGLPIENTTMKLYWADTELNRNKGRTPHTLVNLPILDGFAPNGNRVPQITNSKGEYAWMVFPDGDYYIIAENEKYHTYDSRAEGRNVSAKPGEDSYIKDGVIHVGQDIVEYDFSMKALSDDEDVNHPPSFKDYQFTVKENTVLTEKVTAEDPDGDMLAYSLYKKPSHGSLTLKDMGSFTYVPKPGFSGVDEFILRVADEHGEVSASTVKVTVEGNSLPDAPGNEIFLETFSGKTISGNLEALNIIAPVTIELKQPENGTADVSLSEMNWEYQPEEGFVGEDGFKVLYYNQEGILHTIEVHVQVHENTVPIGSDDEDRPNTNQEREGNSEDHHKEDLDELPKTGSIFDRNLLLAIASLFGSLGILLRRFGRKKENE
ncbi:Ig-like domain-containing protein [Halobacillus yeomjeoni]|uniref:Tandem-95 repeat protein n=1 Tax=Halobacillus yeomjeoni TaxID=311194 RepID=A0A931HUN9_9BACI|nr:Ig-like domain-containing protein [Halobacillus yeomjeoni]MBH0229758.1 tandem-95 repeat protein [Halobacillus yeomjeoni]